MDIIIGSNSLIGQSLVQLLKKKKLIKNFLLFSKSNKNINNYYKLDLDKNINILRNLDVDTCYFFSSPKYIKKNFSKKIYERELFWVKNVVKNCKIKKMIFLSSSTVYQKDHFIGYNKLKIEKYLISKKKKFKFLQIWRPFNLISFSQKKLTDHFHNFLFKIIFIEKKKYHIFQGNSEDKRGYSSINEFVKVLYSFSKKENSFIKNYGNPDLITVNEIIKIFNDKQQDYFKTKLKYRFKAKNSNINSVSNLSKKNTINSKINSNKIIQKFLNYTLKNFKIKAKKSSWQGFFYMP
tara:strand:+ start:16750 stop:17631 length:882 start_codon:yes stop_codon:yes gene_type:complete